MNPISSQSIDYNAHSISLYSTVKVNSSRELFDSGTQTRYLLNFRMAQYDNWTICYLGEGTLIKPPQEVRITFNRLYVHPMP